MKKITVFCLVVVASTGVFATPKYLVQTGKSGDPTWSQATISSTKATLVDLTVSETTLNAFMGSTAGNDEVWIIEGTYTWTAEKSGNGAVTMYGGFAGTETSVDQRQKVANGEPWELVHPTVITGADADGNPYAHFTSNSGQNMRLSGITFTKFSDKGATGDNPFGGFCRFHGTSTINGCQFIDIHAYNDKGGVFESYSDAGGGVISDCLFDNCTSGDENLSQSNMQGGALYLAPKSEGAIVTINNCMLRNCGVYHPASNAGGAIYSHNNVGINVISCVFENNFVKGTGAGVAVCICTTKSAQVVNCLFTGNNDFGNNKSVLFVAGGSSNSTTDVCYVMHNTFVKNINTGAAFQSNGNMVCKNNIFFDEKASGSDLYINLPADRYKVLTNNVYRNGLGTTDGVTMDNTNKKRTDANAIFVDYTNNNFKPRKEVNSMGDNTVATLVDGTATDILGYERSRYVPGCYEWRLLDLSEANDNTTRITQNDQETLPVRTYRTLISASLNSICLPFALTEDQIEESFGAECKIYLLSSAEEKDGCIDMQFEEVTTMDANTPYLIQPKADVTNPIFDNVTIVSSTNLDVVKAAATMHGILAPTALTTGDKNQLFVGAGNALLNPSSNSTLRAMRAYFTLTPSSPSQSVSARMLIGGKAIATAIDPVAATEVNARKTIQNGQLVITIDNKMYNPQGQQL